MGNNLEARAARLAELERSVWNGEWDRALEQVQAMTFGEEHGPVREKLNVMKSTLGRLTARRVSDADRLKAELQRDLIGLKTLAERFQSDHSPGD